MAAWAESCAATDPALPDSEHSLLLSDGGEAVGEELAAPLTCKLLLLLPLWLTL